MEAITTWAQCDACTKWRRVPRALADALDENDAWKCDQNPNPLFASCDIDQELSDHEIDRQLDSNDEEEVPENDHKQRIKRPAVWQVVTENLYTHRARKAQDEDDIMICQCRMRTYGGKGCGPDCLNRLLNIECVPGYCPSCDECNNQMFSKRQYSDIEKRRAGAKGFGLFAKADLHAGQFVIQYLGEVLEEEEYVRRKVHYQASGQRHYYFMNVGNGEVIDACRKGALGRFINHSCDPNCETQKWVVEGELAIGLFATKSIPAGTELTFDYNFERYGDKPMKCLCGSEKCRGFVGGTQETTQSSSNFEEVDDATDDPEPIMVTEAEEDDALAAILDENIGISSNGWDCTLQRRLAALAKQHGVELQGVDSSATAGDAGSDADSCGRPEATAVSGPVSSRKPVRKPTVKARTKPLSRAGKQPAPKSGSGGAKEDAGLPPRKRLKQTMDVDPSASAASASTTAALLPCESAAMTQSPAADDAAKAHATAKAVTNTQPPSPADPIEDKTAEADASDVTPAPTETSAVMGIADDMHIALQAPSTGDSSATRVRAGATSNAATSASTAAAPAARKPARTTSAAMSKDHSRGPSHKPARKRSEIDRRLDVLVPSGKLRDAVTTTTVKVLRLFNLCDISAAGQLPAITRKSHSHFSSQSSGASCTEGATYAGRRQRRPTSWDTEVQSAPIERLELTVRQRARMADLSLLLDVICSTTSPSAKQELVRCGLLRQLHSTLGRNIAPTYQVVLRKMLRAVEGLPLTADDIHLTRSAHGTFGDILGLLALHSDPEVRAKAQGLLQRYPMWACTRPVALGVSGATSTPSPAVPISHGGRFSPMASSSNGVPWSDGTSMPFRGRPHAYVHPPAAVNHHTASRFRTPPSCRPRDIATEMSELPTTPSGKCGLRQYQRSPASAPLHHGETSWRSTCRPSVAMSPQPIWKPPLPQPGNQGADTARADTSGAGSVSQDPSDQQANVSDTAVGALPPSQPPLPPVPIWQHGAAGSLPPGIGSTAGTARDGAALTSIPRMATAADWPLHVAAGVPPEGFPPPSDLLQVERSHSAVAAVPLDDAADVAKLSDVSDGTVDHCLTGFSAPKSGNFGQQNGGAPRLSGSPTRSSEDALAFFAVDVKDAVGSAALEDMPQDWDSPHSEFEAYVSEIVRVRLGRHLQAAPPQHIDLADARALYTKVSQEILEKEQQAYQERDKSGAYKLIERRKLEPKIKEFIRDSVRRLHAAQQTLRTLQTPP